MRVSLYVVNGKVTAALVEPSRGRGLPPVMISDLTKGTLRERLHPVLESLRRPKMVEAQTTF